MNEEPFEIQTILTGIADKLAAIQQDFQTTVDRIDTTLDRIDWQAAEARLEHLSDEATRLGENGWTLPIWATPEDVADILEGARERPIDDVFEEYFAFEDGLFLRQLQRSVVASNALAPWKRLIEESLWAYAHGRFLVVVPAMITVIEGAVIAAGGPPSARDKDPKQTAHRLAAASRHHWFDRAVWTSVRAFLLRLFDPASFAGDNPRTLNRAWILHGRAAPAWTKADCLRLFQAADTIGAWR